MEILSKIIKLLNNKISLPVAILCGFLLFAPDSALENLSLLDFVTSAKVFISLTFLFSALLYSYEKAGKLFQYVKAKVQARTKRKAQTKTIIAHLEGLTPEEEAWIYFCLREHVRTLYTTEIKATAIALENKGLVYRPNGVYDRLSTPFTFYPEVWEYLTQNKDQYCPPEKLNDKRYNQQVDRFIGNLRSVI